MAGWRILSIGWGGEGDTIIKHIPRESKTKRLNGLRDDPSKGFPTTHVQSLVFRLPGYTYIVLLRCNMILYVKVPFDFNQSTRRLGENLLFYIIFLWVQKHYLHPPSPHHVAKDVPKCHRQVFTVLVLSWKKNGKLNQFTFISTTCNLHKQTKTYPIGIQSPENGNHGTYSKYSAFYVGDWDTPIILWQYDGWCLGIHTHTHMTIGDTYSNITGQASNVAGIPPAIFRMSLSEIGFQHSTVKPSSGDHGLEKIT